MASLLIIPGLLMQVNAQYEIPDIPDINIPGMEIPSQEDIEKMMQQNEVSGKYTNTDYGVSVTLPAGWSGMASDFKDPDTGTWITGFQAMKGGLAANMNAMQEGKFTAIFLSILDKSEDKEPPESKPPTDDYDVDCSTMTAEKIKANGRDVMKIQGECSGDDVSMKTRAYHYATADKIVMFAYATSPASDFDNHIDIFEDSVKTLTVANQVNVDYEIPDEMMATSGDPGETMEEEHDDSTAETDDSKEMTNEEEMVNDKEMAEDEQMMDEKEMVDDKEGGGCLIATAAYGSELAPQVQLLREIRDNTLLSTTSGVTFMTGFNQMYYSFSPAIADLERENPMFKEAVKLFITPMLSTLSVMTLAENGNDLQVLGLGISVIALNLGMYVVAPIGIGLVLVRRK